LRGGWAPPSTRPLVGTEFGGCSPQAKLPRTSFGVPDGLAVTAGLAVLAPRRPESTGLSSMATFALIVGAEPGHHDFQVVRIELPR